MKSGGMDVSKAIVSFEGEEKRQVKITVFL